MRTAHPDVSFFREKTGILPRYPWVRYIKAIGRTKSIVTILEFMLIMLTPFLALVDFDAEKAGVVARNVDFLMLIGLGGLLAVAAYIGIEKMISSRVRLLEQKQDDLKDALASLARKMDNLTVLITELQVSQSRLTISKESFESQIQACIDRHALKCPFYQKHVERDRD